MSPAHPCSVYHSTPCPPKYRLQYCAGERACVCVASEEAPDVKRRPRSCAQNTVWKVACGRRTGGREVGGRKCAREARVIRVLVRRRSGVALRCAAAGRGTRHQARWKQHRPEASAAPAVATAISRADAAIIVVLRNLLPRPSPRTADGGPRPPERTPSRGCLCRPTAAWTGLHRSSHAAIHCSQGAYKHRRCGGSQFMYLLHSTDPHSGM